MLFNWTNRQLKEEVYLYLGDCQTQETVGTFITKGNVEAMLGKFICDSGLSPVKLTNLNARDYFGKQVQMRSPITCRYPDGCCLVCLGDLEKYVEYQTSIGLSVVLLPETLSKLSKKDPSQETIDMIEAMVAYNEATSRTAKSPKA